MKKVLFATACAMILFTTAASAQSSQGNVGPGTNQNGSMGNSGNMGNGSGMSNSGNMGGSGMSNSGTTGMSGSSGMNKGVARNPSSQGNVGPGTDNNMTPSSK